MTPLQFFQGYEHFKCKIDLCLTNDPVQIANHPNINQSTLVYDRESIRRWLEAKYGLCPMRHKIYNPNYRSVQLEQCIFALTAQKCKDAILKNAKDVVNLKGVNKAFNFDTCFDEIDKFLNSGCSAKTKADAEEILRKFEYGGDVAITFYNIGRLMSYGVPVPAFDTYLTADMKAEAAPAAAPAGLGAAAGPGARIRHEPAPVARPVLPAPGPSPVAVQAAPAPAPAPVAVGRQPVRNAKPIYPGIIEAAKREYSHNFNHFVPGASLGDVSAAIDAVGKDVFETAMVEAINAYDASAPGDQFNSPYKPALNAALTALTRAGVTNANIDAYALLLSIFLVRDHHPTNVAAVRPAAGPTAAPVMDAPLPAPGPGPRPQKPSEVRAAAKKAAKDAAAAAKSASGAAAPAVALPVPPLVFDPNAIALAAPAPAAGPGPGPAAGPAAAPAPVAAPAPAPLPIVAPPPANSTMIRLF